MQSQNTYVNTLPSAIKTSLREYTKSHYEKINSDLFSLGEVELPDHKVMVDHIDQAFKNAPELEQSIKLYRGFRNQFEAGVHLGYFSTSEDVEISLEFANEGSEGEYYLMQVTVPKGMKVLPLNSISANQREKEVLLPRNVNLRMDGLTSLRISTKNGTRVRTAALVTVIPTTKKDILLAKERFNPLIVDISEEDMFKLILDNILEEEVELFGLESAIDMTISLLDSHITTEITEELRNKIRETYKTNL